MSLSTPKHVSPPVLAGTKRRHSDISRGTSGISDSITIHNSNTNTSHHFTILTHIRRSQLPLTFLDLNTSDGYFGIPRLCPTTKTTIQALFHGSQSQTPKLVVLRDLKDHRLYVSEQVDETRLCTHRLEEWITLGHLTGRGPELHVTASKMSKSEPWWRAHVLPMQTPYVESTQISTVRAIARQSLSLPTPVPEPMEIVQSPLEQTVQPQPRLPLLEQDQPHQDLRLDYLNALYLSKTTLAYFAKGPMARSRVNLIESRASYLQHITYLQSLIYSTKLYDKRYSTTLPDLAKQIVSEISKDQTTPHEKFFRKLMKKGKERACIGKSGLQPGEETVMIQMCTQFIEESGLELTNEGLEKKLINALHGIRTRETQLQIILLLEVIALEHTTSQLPEIKVEADHENMDSLAMVKSPNSKANKTKDAHKLLDGLLDKLCIWQSMQEDKPTEKHSPAKAVDNSHPHVKADGLRDFASEIVVPYYANRIPTELYQSLCQKLGLSSGSSSSRARKPDVPSSTSKTPRADNNKHGKDAASKLKTPRSLKRSATDSLVPNLKRELSVTSFGSSAMRTNRINKREVDLTAVSQATAARLQQKARIDAELNDAISALKRPNARLAVKEYVEYTDARTGKTVMGRKLERSMTAPGVQVFATPRTNRKRHVGSSATSQPKPMVYNVDNESDTNEPQLPPIQRTVPSSTVKPRVSGTPAKRPAHRGLATSYSQPNLSIAATPSKPKQTARAIDPALSNANKENMHSIQPPSSLFAQPSAVPVTPQKAQSQPQSRDAESLKTSLPKTVAPSTSTSTIEQRTSLLRMGPPATPQRSKTLPEMSTTSGVSPLVSTTPETALNQPTRAINQSLHLGMSAVSQPTGSIYDLFGWNDDDNEEMDLGDAFRALQPLV